MAAFVTTAQHLGQILVAGVLIGAGLPALFALGVRLLATSDADGGSAVRRPVGLIGAVACFSLVVVAVVTGILFIMKDFLAHDFGIHLF
jgi:hypothetical protein